MSICLCNISVFLGTQENPELIWNDEARERLCSIVKNMANEYVFFFFVKFIKKYLSLFILFSVKSF